MYWKKHLDTKEIPRRKLRKIVSKINAKKAVPHIYVVALGESQGTLLEIIPAFVLCQQNYPSGQLKIVGLACHKKNACLLACELIGRIWNETQTADVKGYFADAAYFS